MVTDNNVEPFHYHGWGPIEHFAAQGVIKDAIWTARLGCLGLKARIDIPVAGTMINVVNDRLQVEHPPNGWPITAESGWLFFPCDCLMASMARSVDCLIQNILDTVQVHLIGAEPIVQVKK